MHIPTIRVPLVRRRTKIIASTIAGIVIVLVAYVVLQGADFQVLNVAGTVAEEQRSLIIFTVVLSLIIIVPVFGLLIGILWRFREGNKNAKYRPNWDGSKTLESIWWGLPCAIIIVLSGVIWTSSHALDPYKPLDSNKTPVEVQVVALQWKWLFIYPKENIATVNQLYMPVDTPVNFEISADAPMNSFWIPKLGGQVYAMNGMSTKLHLQASEVGDYNGSSVNISGKGFAGMKFIAHATTDKGYETWLKQAKNETKTLDMQSYEILAKPTENVIPATYKLTDSSLYDTIVGKYMSPTEGDNGMNMTDGAHMEGMKH